MESNLPPGCPTLPDGLVLMAALVGLEDNRFSSMFLNGIQSMLCLWGLLNNYPNAVPVEESINCCKNCALKLHLYITCTGCRFGKWFLDAAGGGGFKINALTVWSGEIWSVQRSLLITFGTVLLLQIQPLSEHGCPFFLLPPRPHLVPMRAVLQLSWLH